ncbi:MAG TPA: FkbM family methyltransferase [Candidatus Baltobacteraceae bacterium]|nr:FkbM family methyltransferase [Candidatus Baltobacteraceae bacterium]
MNVEKPAFLDAAERVGIPRSTALELWDEIRGPLAIRSGLFTSQNVARLIAPIKAVHHRFFGPEAALSSVPLAFLRLFYGDDLTTRIRNKPFTVNLHDTIVSFEILAYRKWQPLETMLYERLIRPGDFVIDVGANIGYFTVLFAELTGSGGRVLAIEPEPNNARLLRKNVEQRANAPVVTIAQTAVGSEPGTATLYVAASGNLGDNRMYFTEERHGIAAAKDRKTTEVPMTRVDDLVAGWPRVDFIKMDIQGFEGHALKGMTGVLGSNPDVLLFTEFFPYGMRAAGIDPFEFIEQLRSFGFDIWETGTDRQPLRHVLREDDRRFLERVEPDRGEANLLCAKGESAIKRAQRLTR